MAKILVRDMLRLNEEAYDALDGRANELARKKKDQQGAQQTREDETQVAVDALRAHQSRFEQATQPEREEKERCGADGVRQQPIERPEHSNQQ